jgi:HAD superfamily hydrolase (TIGR01450 family)
MGAGEDQGARPAVCCDLDGVIWRGDEPIPGAAEAVAALRAAGCTVGFMSNNSSVPVGEVAAKLGRFGIAVSEEHVLTSAMAAADLLVETMPPPARVLACAGPGVFEAVAHAGYEVVTEGPADAVVVGFHRNFDFDGLQRAADAVRAGARFVATNLDATYPIPGGLLPGAGSIVAAVATASGRTPEVAGKPAAGSMVRHRLGDRRDGRRPAYDRRRSPAARLAVLSSCRASRLSPVPARNRCPTRRPSWARPARSYRASSPPWSRATSGERERPMGRGGLWRVGVARRRARATRPLTPHRGGPSPVTAGRRSPDARHHLGPTGRAR